MQLGLSENLSALVARRFVAAKEGNHLVFSHTHLSIVTAAGIPYQVRYCPALAKKPTNLKPEPPKGPKPDPFENPSPELLLAQFPAEKPSHALVLNKFPVIPNHFILTTTEWREQTDLLEKVDLEATYECLRSWGNDNANANTTTTKPNGNGTNKPRLFAFFNSGEDSGASQPHRHLQFLPVEAMRSPGAEGWDPLIELLAAQNHSRPESAPQRSSATSTSTSKTTSDATIASPAFQYHAHLPFAHYALPLPRKPIPRNPPRNLPIAEKIELSSHGPAAISYNFAMTLDTMMIAPRSSETADVPVDLEAAADMADPGVVSLNGTILAGTLMVKAEAEWDALRFKPDNLIHVLQAVGYKRVDSHRPGGSLL
ncbi:ATP adenylyltransferase C-terminal [Penicillium verhagenii]|nr:ATP adenylyltransferase C-terminal [Penicillium verhagenii]